MATVVHEYFALCQSSRAQYGDDCVVMMQVGDFVEMYALKGEDAGWASEATLRGVCECVNILLTSKNKKNPVCDMKNPMMAGFPVVHAPRYVRILVEDHAYTVVEVEQTDILKADGTRERRVARVHSPGTYTERALVQPDEHNLMVIYVDVVDATAHVGIAVCDVSTGECSFEEFSVPRQDLESRVASRCLEIRPRECLSIDPQEALADSSVRTIDHTGRFKPDHERPVYQNKQLAGVFGSTGMLSPLEWANLELTVHARSAFAYMAQFLVEQRCGTEVRLRQPRDRSLHDGLILSNDSALQLDVLSTQPGRGLVALLSTCVTPMGKRRMRRVLCRPMTDVASIEARHEMIATLAEHPERTQALRGGLREIRDVIRIANKCAWVPKDAHALARHLRRSHEVLGYAAEHLPNFESDDSAPAAFRVLEVLRDDDTLALYPKCNVFRVGVHADIDALDRRMTEIAGAFEEVQDGKAVVLSFGEKDGYQLTIKRAAHDRGTSKSVINGLLGGRSWTSAETGNKTLLSITTKDHTEMNQEYMAIRARMSKLVRDRFEALERAWKECHMDAAHAVTERIAALDVDCANATNAERMGLVRPRVCRDARGSRFVAKGLRHPIIEQVAKGVRYVANDVEIACSSGESSGGESSGGSNQGMLIYGVNAAGKSSLMKSVGLAVVMAQAGMYVAARELELSVYDTVHTRILSTDNLYRGQSTFVREMSEMRAILRDANPRSLVIGDELCSGTESASAVALVGAGIDSLLRAGACFVMATHLHELHSIPEVTENPAVRVVHLAVTFEEGTGRLVYDRTIREGSGDSMYGLEVCRSLDMSAHFMSTANRIRDRLKGCAVDPKRSRYNRDVFANGACAVCRKREVEEVHHIAEQAKAAHGGRIVDPKGSFHKNEGFNLVPLCAECHRAAHHGSLSIDRYRHTSEGTKLGFKWSENELSGAAKT